jgi:SpoVK/Ycf46/Vps4 family AAA+-type ATPase
MVGMKTVANEMDSLVSTALVNERRREAGLPVASSSNHLIFTGNPGTGKTTVANKLAGMYHAAGILPKDTVTVTGRNELVGEYANNISSNVTKIFNKARGGVLFVDEAYMLSDDNLGREAATQLMKLMEEHKDDTVVIVAGYPDKMQEFIDINPGMKSRFSRIINFPDYTLNDQKRILSSMFRNNQEKVKDAKTASAISSAVRYYTARGGNGRAMERLHYDLYKARSERLAGQPDATEKDLSVFTIDDVKNALDRQGFKPRKTAVKKPALKKPTKKVVPSESLVG